MKATVAPNRDSMNSMDNSELKEFERKTWAAVAEGWRRRDELLRKGSAPVTERMLELAAMGAGQHVLDIASGTGEPAISAARRVGDTGRVIGTDLVDGMLTVAREKVAQAKLNNIEFLCIDGETLEFGPSSFDAVTIRWGLMFMPEPEACLRRVYRQLKNNGRVVIACWAEPERNPFVSVMMEILAKYREMPKASPNATGMFAFADPERLRTVLQQTGFADIQIEDMVVDIIEVDNAANYCATMLDLAGPVKALVDQLDSKTRDKFIENVIAIVSPYEVEGTLRMRGTTWIASGTRL